uniref:Uncharacterized protein n=1 Tax=Sipha flava TaxID=143950 RepID=A0A2S2QDZ2_9HEMI
MFVKFIFTKNSMITNNTVFSQELNDRESNENVNDEVVHVALLDLSMLLQPNCTSVRCLSTVHALDENIIQTHGFSSAALITEEFIEKNTIGDQHLEKSSIPLLDVSKDLSTHFIPDNSADRVSPFVVVDISVSNSFYDQYLKHVTSKMLELNIILEKPMATTVAPITSNKYQECLKTTIESLIGTSIRINDPDGDNEDYYVNELKDSGVYGSMQSLLCNEIRQYIIDNYAGPMIGETIQSFVNRIFMDLVDKMKKTVKSFEFSHSCGDAENVVKSDHDMMIVYAREADELKQTERAKKICFDLISTAGTRCNPNYWLLYASFCSRRLDFNTALEYVKEVLLVDSGNQIGLFLYAAIQLTIYEDNNNGEIVLKSLIMSHGDFSEVYALLSVHYYTLNMYKTSKIMLQRALKTVEKDEFENNNLLHENLLSWQSIGHSNNPLIKCAILLLKHELVELATRCLKLVVEHSEQYHYYMAVCENKKGNYSASLEHLEHKILLGKYEKCFDALRYLNDIELNESMDVLKNYLLQVIHTEKPRKELHLVYLKCALRCYTNKWYARGTEICRIAGNVLRTPMVFTLLAKCLIEYGLKQEMKKEINTLLKRRHLNI